MGIKRGFSSNSLNLGGCFFIFLSLAVSGFCREELKYDRCLNLWYYDPKDLTDPFLGLSGEQLEYDQATGGWSFGIQESPAQKFSFGSTQSPPPNEPLANAPPEQKQEPKPEVTSQTEAQDTP